MPDSNSVKSPIGFGIIDFITRVVPGASLIISLMVIISPGSIETNISNFQLLLFVLASFLIGEFVNSLRLIIYPVPRTFLRLINEQNGRETQESMVDRIRKWLGLSPGKSDLFTHTQEEFWERLCNEFEFEGFVHGRDIYYIFLDRVESHFSRRMRRLQAIYHFAVNMSLVAFFSLFYALYEIIILSGDVWDFAFIFGVSPLLFPFFLIGVGGDLERKYVGNLLRVYYPLST